MFDWLIILLSIVIIYFISNIIILILMLTVKKKNLSPGFLDSCGLSIIILGVPIIIAWLWFVADKIVFRNRHSNF